MCFFGQRRKIVFLNCKWTAKPHLNPVHWRLCSLFSGWPFPGSHVLIKQEGSECYRLPFDSSICCLRQCLPRRPTPCTRRQDTHVLFLSHSYHFGCHSGLSGTSFLSVNEPLKGCLGNSSFHGSLSRVSRGYFAGQKWFYLQTRLWLPLEIGPRNGMVDRLGLKCLIVLATLKTVCFPFVGLNHKIVKWFVFVLLFFYTFWKNLN